MGGFGFVFAFEARGEFGGAFAGLTQVSHQGARVAVSGDDVLGAGSGDGGLKAGPIDVIGKDKAAVDGLPPAVAADLHPARSDRDGFGMELANPGSAFGTRRGDDDRSAFVKLGIFDIGIESGRQVDALLPVGLGHGVDRAVQQNRADGWIEHGQCALGFTKRIGQQDGRAVVRDIFTPPAVDVSGDLVGGFPAEDGKAKRAFGDEGVAADQFEGFAGGIGIGFVIAGEDPDFIFVFHAHLRGAEQVTRGVEGDQDAIHVDGLAVVQCVDLDVVTEAAFEDGLAISGDEVAL